jgi:hypothetical protein
MILDKTLEFSEDLKGSLRINSAGEIYVADGTQLIAEGTKLYLSTSVYDQAEVYALRVLEEHPDAEDFVEHVSELVCEHCCCLYLAYLKACLHFFKPNGLHLGYLDPIYFVTCEIKQ